MKRTVPGRLYLFMTAVFLVASPAAAETATLSPAKDNTLYESETGSFSNGAGWYLFAGQTNHAIDGIRRGLIAFDIAGNLPPGTVVNSVELRMHMSKTHFVSGPRPVELHRLLVDWGEGISDAALEEGAGIAPAEGDATWLHRFFPDQLWSARGGDFEPTASATQVVNDVAHYTWGSTPQMVADVQSWLDHPDENFGWLLRCNEGALGSAKRFDSRENPVGGDQPILTIDYTAAATPCETCPGDLTADAVVNADDIAAFVVCFASGDPNAPGCGCADLDASAAFSEEDITLLVTGLLQDTLNCPPP